MGGACSRADRTASQSSHVDTRKSEQSRPSHPPRPLDVKDCVFASHRTNMNLPPYEELPPTLRSREFCEVQRRLPKNASLSTSSTSLQLRTPRPDEYDGNHDEQRQYVSRECPKTPLTPKHDAPSVSPTKGADHSVGSSTTSTVVTDPLAGVDSLVSELHLWHPGGDFAALPSVSLLSLQK